MTRSETEISNSLITIGQAWIWKSQNVLMATDLGEMDPCDPGLLYILKGLINHEISDVLVGIATVFATLVDYSINEKTLIGESTILDNYELAIAKVTENVEEYVRKPGVENMGIEKEKDFIHQISDIREELTMVRRVLTQQEEVWGEFASNIWPEIWAKSNEGQKPYYIDSPDFEAREKEKELMRTVLRPNLRIQKARRRVNQLDEDADRVERSIITQLDLKAKHASLREAHATAIMSAAVFGFSVVTIVFTPLSFAMSLFALPIQRFQDNQIQSRWTDQAGMYVSNYIGKWTAIAEVVSVSLTVVTSWLALEWGLKYRVTARMICFFVRTSVKLIRKLWITNFIFYHIVLLLTKGVRFRDDAQKRYVKRLMDDLQEISLYDRSEQRKLKEIGHSEISLISQLKAMSQIEEDYLLKGDKNETEKPKSNDGGKPIRRHRWRKWRNTDIDEEHGEAGETTS